jgi:sugar lactone lactonase YvrE
VTVSRRSVGVELVGGRGTRHQVGAEWYGIGVELGESPVWIQSRETLASLDIPGQRLHLLRPGTSVDEVVALPRRATAVMPGAGSTVVLATDRLLQEYRMDEHTIRPWPDRPGGSPPGTIFNDAKADRGGRIWIGARRPDGSTGGGSLLRWDRGQRPVARVAGLTGPNGLAWNVAGDRLYLADSRERRIHRYRFDQHDGALTDGRVFTSWTEREGRPDGLTVDADDHLWCAAWDGSSVRRYDPRGRLAETLVLPAARPTSCAFGGPRFDRLWVTTARAPSNAPSDMGGGLFAVDVGRTGFAPDSASVDTAQAVLRDARSRAEGSTR